MKKIIFIVAIVAPFISYLLVSSYQEKIRRKRIEADIAEMQRFVKIINKQFQQYEK